MVSGCGLLAQAQPGNAGPKLPYEKITVPEREEIPNSPLREADVLYNKKVQRIIDTREKKNMVMNWPGNPLSKILIELTTVGPDKKGFGVLKMYKSDSLTSALTIEDFEKLTSACEIIEVQDTLTDDIYAFIEVEYCPPFEYQKINRFLVTEEWIFNKQRGTYEPHITSIAPLFKPALAGVELSEMPLFFVSFEELRPYIINEEVFNRQNGVRFSYCDFFDQRLFSSYITKESNMYDYAINQMPEFQDNPMEALYEGERIKQDLMERGQDFWED